MEITYNATPSDLQQQVHATLLLKTFDALCAKACRRFTLMPLKRIDLVHSFYADTLDREFKDFDQLVLPTKHTTDFVTMLPQNGYRPEFAFPIDPVALAEKLMAPKLSSSYSMCICAYDFLRPAAAHGAIPYRFHRPLLLAL
ncbi:MAG: hypothetical protein IKP36_00535 [Bacteroidaceae bacterium]|nr:hypothetical protein [Bacteroidaceae bacterium]